MQIRLSVTEAAALDVLGDPSVIGCTAMQCEEAEHCMAPWSKPPELRTGGAQAVGGKPEAQADQGKR